MEYFGRLRKWACGLMDKAPDFGSGDCRFESCHGRSKSFDMILKENEMGHSWWSSDVKVDIQLDMWAMKTSCD